MAKKGTKVEKVQERVDFEPAKLDENAASVYAELSASLPTAEAASAAQEAEAKVMQAGADARAQRIYELEAKIAAMEAKAAGEDPDAPEAEGLDVEVLDRPVVSKIDKSEVNKTHTYRELGVKDPAKLDARRKVNPDTGQIVRGSFIAISGNLHEQG